MSQVQGNMGGQFDANKVAPKKAFEPIPTSWQPAMMIKSEIVAVDGKKGKGSGAKLTWQITDGPHKGRQVYDFVNLKNTNPNTQAMGDAQTSAICHATGFMMPQDTSQWHNLPCYIRVKPKPAKDGYDASNSVGDYRPLSDPPKQLGAPAAVSAAAPAPAPAPAPQAAPAAAPQPAPAPAPVAAPAAAPVAPATPTPEPAPPATDADAATPTWMQ